MDGADSGHAMRARERAPNHISPVPVSVYHLWLELGDNAPERAIFAQIATRSSHDGGHGDVRFFQSGDERVVIHIIGRKNRGDVNSVASLSLGQHRNNTLEPTLSSGRKECEVP
jgi:hypothetical protein